MFFKDLSYVHVVKYKYNTLYNTPFSVPGPSGSAILHSLVNIFTVINCWDFIDFPILRVYFQPHVLGTHFQWRGKTKSLGSFIYGTSPEFDMALITVCYYTRRNQGCDFTVDGHNVHIQTYDTTHGSGNHLGSAFFGWKRLFMTVLTSPSYILLLF